VTNPYAPPTATVDDVRATTSVALAERSTRLGAAMLDGLIFAALVYLPLLIGAGVADRSSGKPGEAAGLGLAILGFLVWTGITLRYMSQNGQSIGKKIVGIKVVRRDGSTASLARLVLLRNFVNGLLSIIPFYGLADTLAIFGETRQCLHDRLADTMVIQG